MKKYKVLLINSTVFKKEFTPINIYFPMGLLSLASVLHSNEIEVKIFDCALYSEKNKDYNIIDIVNEFGPDIIGIGCTFSGAFPHLKIIASQIKSHFSNIPIVIGGMHATIFSEIILKKYTYIDYIVIGEGENTFLELVKCIRDKKSLPSSLNGIAFRDKNNITLIPKKTYEENLDSLPFTNYDLIDVNSYEIDTSNWYSPKNLKISTPYTIISSRSCPIKCNFCSMHLIHGPKIRYRSANNVLDEIEQLNYKYNANYFHFMDDNLTFNKQRILDICNGIKKRNLNIQFDTPNGISINKLDEEVISAMVDAGLVYTALGIESGSEYIRNKIMKKGLSNDKIYKTIDICSKYKTLFIKGFFIIGVPQETKETLEETFQMIKNLPLDKLCVCMCSPYPGTDLFNYCISNNLLPHNEEDYVDIEIFQDTDENPHFTPHEISKEYLVEFRKKCFNYIKEKREKNLQIKNNHPLR
jgi:magnesium-protoporphyrin IX monomethyl ester (oxidative) cyclase